MNIIIQQGVEGGSGWKGGDKGKQPFFLGGIIMRNIFSEVVRPKNSSSMGVDRVKQLDVNKSGRICSASPKIPSIWKWGSEDSEKGIKDDENMESPNILMSHVHISHHCGRQTICRSSPLISQELTLRPFTASRDFSDNVLLVLFYTTSKNQESYHDRLSREVSQQKVEHDLTPSWI